MDVVITRIRNAIGGATPLPKGATRPTQADADEKSSAADSKSEAGSAATAKQGKPAPRSSRATKRTEKGAALAFRDNWLAIKAILANPDQAALHHGVSRTDLASRLLDLCDGLVFEANRADDDMEISGPCMEMLLEGDVLGHLVRWTANDRIAGSQAEVVGLFAALVILLDERFLSRQAVHKPLVRLMRICVGDEFFSNAAAEQASAQADAEVLGNGGSNNDDEEKRAHRRYGRMGSAEVLGYEEKLVDLMCHVASRLRNSPELLIIFFRERGGDDDARRAFNKAMTGSSGTPSRISTRAPSPTRSASPAMRPSAVPLISSPLRPPESLPPPPSMSLLPGLSPGKGGVISDAASQASSNTPASLSYDFPLFSYLMRFVHRESRTGELARAGILFLVDVAFAPGRRNLARNKLHQGKSGTFGRQTMMRSLRGGSNGRRSGTGTPQKARIDVDLGIGPSIALARFMLESDFAEVLGAGVGAVYGLLPTKLAHTKSRAADEAGQAGKAATLVGGHEETMVLGRDGEMTSGVEEVDASLPTSNSEEVRNQARLLCDLLEFTQDILRTTTRVAQTGIVGGSGVSGVVGLGLEDGSRPSRPPTSLELAGIARSLTGSLSSALQTLFLESILYPSMLECSDVDGSSVAVMSYLEAMMSVLETDNALADCILGWLVGRDVDSLGPLSSLEKREKANDRRPKHKSTAMIQLEKEQESQHVRQNAPYFNDVLGRYTIRDLIVDNLASSTAPMAAVAALRLASTLFAFHGRFTLSDVIRVDLDDYATGFPTVLIESIEKHSGSEDEDDDAGADDDSEEFVYPGTSKDDERFNERLRKLVRGAVGGLTALQFSQEMGAYLALVADINRGKGTALSMGGDGRIADATTLSTGFDKYLDDAEMGIMHDSMYRITMRAMDDDDGSGEPESGLAAIALNDARQEEERSRPERDCLRHRLNAHDRLMRSVLASLCHFWQNRPEVNVALTGLIAVLAMCPLRSLEDFLTFPREAPQQEYTIASGGSDASGTSYEEENEYDPDDDRSDDERMFAKKVQSIPKKQSNKKTGVAAVPTASTRTTKIPVIISILRALVQLLQQQRSNIEDFDKVLSERRRGLLFVENLDEALKVSDLSDDAEEGAIDKIPTPYDVYASQRGSSKAGGAGLVDEHVEASAVPSQIAHGPKRSISISLPPPPSATPSLGMPHIDEAMATSPSESSATGTAKAATPTAERKGFARFFGRVASRTMEGGGPAPAATAAAAAAAATASPIPAPKPFAQHYLQTASVDMELGAVRLSSLSPWSQAYDAEKASAARAGDESAILVGGPLTTKRTRFKDATAGSDDESESFMYPGIGDDTDELEKSASSKKLYGRKRRSVIAATPQISARSPSSVSLSMVLDNAVILEESIKEIVAILQVRRAFGIDPVQYV